MAETHRASIKADARRTVPEMAALSPGMTEELAALRAIIAAANRSTGVEFFQALVRHLATAVDAKYAFIAEFTDIEDRTRVRTIALWAKGRMVENLEWDLAGTPCDKVVQGNLCHYPAEVRRRFPEDPLLVEWGVESYLGLPLRDSAGTVIGHIAVSDDRAMPEEPQLLLTFGLFAARAGSELGRLRLEAKLRDSEERLRDLYEEAPIAYVTEDLESRFISANLAAQRILGIKPEEVEGLVGNSLAPDTPDAQMRIQEAYGSIGRGTDSSGVVLEMRRKDDGRPVWIQWWSKPEPGGKYTRTMFVDITDRVLMEQEQARLTAQNIYLQEEIKSVHNFDEIVGQSPALRAALEKVSRVARTDASVLVTGETGTGKELIARAIHSASPRRDKPLIKLNCAALPANLIESELFGHEKGAFSGAINRRVGRFELANGGTIFLDEIGEVPVDLQAKLLRVLQEREFERIGGTTPIKVDVRVIAATNRDLLQSIREGKFREDLFYRLNVFPIAMPPLRDRQGDVPLLVQSLVARFAARVGVRIESIGKETMDRLNRYPWPGNIRELENILERAVILSNGPVLEIDPEVFASADLAKTPTMSSSGIAESGAVAAPAADSAQHSSHAPSPLQSLEAIERNHIVAALERTRWIIDGPKGAAKILALHPNTLRSRMKKLGIARE